MPERNGKHTLIRYDFQPPGWKPISHVSITYWYTVAEDFSTSVRIASVTCPCCNGDLTFRKVRTLNSGDIAVVRTDTGWIPVIVLFPSQNRPNDRHVRYLDSNRTETIDSNSECVRCDIEELILRKRGT